MFWNRETNCNFELSDLEIFEVAIGLQLVQDIRDTQCICEWLVPAYTWCLL